MIRALVLVVIGALASASDALHVPLLCKHWQDSHAVAGSLVGLGMDAYLKEVTPLRPVPRVLYSVAAALLVGLAKEHLVDHHPRNREVPAWGYGAAAACISFEVRF